MPLPLRAAVVDMTGHRFHSVDGGTPSSRGKTFHVVDVFTRGDERFTGNQLAVFHDAADFDADEALALTRETNFSECTFVGGTTDAGRDVRIFDPAEEIPFAGHPTLGTAAVLRELEGDGSTDRLTLDLGVGPIDVWVEGVGGGPGGDSDDGGDYPGSDHTAEEYWMRQIPPEFGETVPGEVAADVLGLELADIDDEYPVQAVSTGLPTLVVPLASLDAVERASTTEPAYGEFIDEYGGHNVLAFARGGVDGGDLHARVFADWAGVPEDPATGSAAGCLAGWLLERGYLGHGPVAATVEQGYELGRPSRLRLRAERNANGDPRVEVGGSVVPVAEGRLL